MRDDADIHIFVLAGSLRILESQSIKMNQRMLRSRSTGSQELNPHWQLNNLQCSGLCRFLDVLY